MRRLRACFPKGKFFSPQVRPLGCSEFQPWPCITKKNAHSGCRTIRPRIKMEPKKQPFLNESPFGGPVWVLCELAGERLFTYTNTALRASEWSLAKNRNPNWAQISLFLLSIASSRENHLSWNTCGWSTKMIVVGIEDLKDLKKFPFPSCPKGNPPVQAPHG